jgi:hypothetical protein
LALFSKRTELDKLHHRREALAAQLTEVDKRVVEAEAQRQRELIDGVDNGQPAKSPAVISRLKDEAAAVRLAVDTVSQRITAAEAQQRADADKAAREQEAERRKQQIAAARLAADEFAAATEKLVEALQILSPLNMTTSSASGSVKIFGGQLIAAVAAALAECTGYCQRVAAGTVAIIGSPQPIATASPPAPEISRTAVMLFQASRWSEGDQVCTGPQYGIVKLPVELAKQACARNLAVRTDDPRYFRLRETEAQPYGMAWAKPLPQDTVVDLDHPDAPPTPEPAAASEWIGPAQVGVATISSARW